MTWCAKPTLSGHFELDQIFRLLDALQSQMLINIDEISPAACFGPKGYICFWECLVFALCCLDGASSCFLAQLLCCCFSVLAVAGRLLFKGLREALQAWKAPRCQVLRASVVKCCSSPVGCRLVLLSIGAVVGCSWLQEVSVAVCHAIVCVGRLLLLVGSVAVCGPAAVSLGWS
jgi:hypothetical protein